jgi:protease I
MHKPLAGRKVAILVGNGFDEIQMTDCQRALLGAGATVKIVSTASGLVNGWQGKGWGHYYPVDQPVAETLAADFDMLYLPGGERSLTKLLETAHTVRIVRGFRDAGKPVAAIGSGIDLLIASDRIVGAEISTSECNAAKAAAVGAKPSQEPITQDGNLLTARDDAELATFIAQALEMFASSESLRSAA